MSDPRTDQFTDQQVELMVNTMHASRVSLNLPVINLASLSASLHEKLTAACKRSAKNHKMICHICFNPENGTLYEHDTPDFNWASHPKHAELVGVWKYPTVWNGSVFLTLQKLALKSLKLACVQSTADQLLANPKLNQMFGNKV